MSSLIRNYDTLYTQIYDLNQQQVPSIEPQMESDSDWIVGNFVCKNFRRQQNYSIDSEPIFVDGRAWFLQFFPKYGIGETHIGAFLQYESIEK